MNRELNVNNVSKVYSWSFIKKEGYEESHIVKKVANQPIEKPQLCSFCGKPIHNHGWVYSYSGSYERGKTNKLVCPNDLIIECNNGEVHVIPPEEYNRIKAEDTWLYSDAKFIVSEKDLGMLEVLPQPTFLQQIYTRPAVIDGKDYYKNGVTITDSKSLFRIQETPIRYTINIPEDTLIDITPLTIGISREVLKRALTENNDFKVEVESILKEALISYKETQDLTIIDEVLTKLFGNSEA